MSNDDLKTLTMNEVKKKPGLQIPPDQDFRIQVRLISTDVRDAFTGRGPEVFAEAMLHAQRICSLYEGSRIEVLLKSKTQQ